MGEKLSEQHNVEFDHIVDFFEDFHDRWIKIMIFHNFCNQLKKFIIFSLPLHFGDK